MNSMMFEQPNMLSVMVGTVVLFVVALVFLIMYFTTSPQPPKEDE